MEIKKAWNWRWSELVNKIERVQTFFDKEVLLDKLCRPEKPWVLAFVNAHAMNLLSKSESFFDSLCAADTVLRDGSGMETLFNQLNMLPGLNLNGTDLIPDLVRKFNGRCIAILGTEEPYLYSGAQFVKMNLAPQSRYFRANGFLDEEDYISLVTLNKPELIILGMGMPRQEKVAVALRREISHPCLIVCGGAIIDFWGGKTSRAPLWMRSKGLEWVFRLQMEPRRLFSRYVIGNLSFLLRVLVFPVLNRRLIK